MVNDTYRIKRILGKIEQIWKKYPTKTFGQIMAGYVYRRGVVYTTVEDDIIEHDLDIVLAELVS